MNANYSALKKEHPSFWDNMNEAEVHYAKWNRPTQKGKYCIISIICAIY